MENTTDAVLAGLYAKKLFDKVCNSCCEKYELTTVERDILLFLGNHPEYDTAKEIVEKRGILKSQVSQGVESLVKKNYVKRSTDVEERRLIHLNLQDKANKVIVELQELQQRYLALLFEGFTEQEIQRWNSYEERILNNMKKNM